MAQATSPELSLGFSDELELQRWDDHRLYHRSYVNQSLHLGSALSFWVVYAALPFFPAEAAILGWVVSMWSRQIGHFFCEPKDFDDTNRMSHQEKEDVKVGFNILRKVLLLGVWAVIPVVIVLDPTFLGLLEPVANTRDVVDRIGYAWIVLALTGLLARTGWLMVTRRPQTGLVWLCKILTDPFNDVRWYWKAPVRLLRGERLDPMTEGRPAFMG
jgi:hypothetical protein